MRSLGAWRGDPNLLQDGHTGFRVSRVFPRAFFRVREASANLSMNLEVKKNLNLKEHIKTSGKAKKPNSDPCDSQWIVVLSSSCGS